MKHKALIGFNLTEYPEAGIFKDFFECDFNEYSYDFFISNIERYSILVPHLYLNISEEMIKKGNNLQYIFTPSTGTNHLDLDAINRLGIDFQCLSDNEDFINDISSTAELSWLLILSSLRRISLLTSRVRDDNSWKNNDLRGFQLKNKTLGIIGFGRLGKLVYRYAKAFDVKTLVYDIDQSKVEQINDSVDLETLYKKSDIISLHPKLNKSSYEMINKDSLELMKDGVNIVNTSRGDVINSFDLIDALSSGKVSFAALDVLKNEFHSGKLPDDPLINFANDKKNFNKILITPHAGGSTIDAHNLVFSHVARELNKKINI